MRGAASSAFSSEAVDPARCPPPARPVDARATRATLPSDRRSILHAQISRDAILFDVEEPVISNR